jgi:predicted ester cyclase
MSFHAPDFVADYRSYQRGHWGSIAPSGKKLSFEEIVILRLVTGKVAGQRGIVDNLNPLRQPGVVPTPPGA